MEDLSYLRLKTRPIKSVFPLDTGHAISQHRFRVKKDLISWEDCIDHIAALKLPGEKVSFIESLFHYSSNEQYEREEEVDWSKFQTCGELKTRRDFVEEEGGKMLPPFYIQAIPDFEKLVFSHLKVIAIQKKVFPTFPTLMSKNGYVRFNLTRIEHFLRYYLKGSIKRKYLEFLVSSMEEHPNVSEIRAVPSPEEILPIDLIARFDTSISQVSDSALPSEVLEIAQKRLQSFLKKQNERKPQVRRASLLPHQMTATQIEVLYTKLNKGNVISSSTSYDTFKGLFYSNPNEIHYEPQPVNLSGPEWQIIALFDELEKVGLMKREYKSKKFSILAPHFINQNGNKCNNRQMRNQFDTHMTSLENTHSINSRRETVAKLVRIAQSVRNISP